MPDSSQPQMSTITSVPDGQSRQPPHELEDAGDAGGVVVGAQAPWAPEPTLT